VAAAALADTAPAYDDILQRCLPQLQQHYRGLYRAKPDVTNTIVDNLEVTHRVGDFASFSESPAITSSISWEVNPTLCRIPAAGQEQAPVPATVFRPRPGEPSQLRRLCTEADGTGGDHGDVVNLDLRRAGYSKIVGQASYDHRVELAFVNAGDGPELLTCSLNAWGPWNVIAAPAPSLVVAEAGELGPRGGDDVYHGVGFLPSAAAAIRVTTPDHVVHRIPVRRVNALGRPFGVYAYFLRTPAHRAAAQLLVRVLDSADRVISTQHWPDAWEQNGGGR
jgi:hypothetical protein